MNVTGALLVLFVFSLSLSSTAFADDAGTISPTQRWEGFYTGVSAGQESGEYSRFAGNSMDVDGSVFGAYMGYHYPIDDRIIIGAEIAGEYADVGASWERITCTVTDCGYEILGLEENRRNFGGQFLFEAGITAGDFLVSGLIGPAWAQYEQTNSYSYSGGPNMGIVDTNMNTTNMFGWTYGTQVSFLTMGDNTSIAARWTHTDLSGDDYQGQYRNNVYSGGQAADHDALTLRVSIRR